MSADDLELPGLTSPQPERRKFPDRVIDSFLVVDGRAARLKLHIDRTAEALEDAFGDRFAVPSREQVRRVYAEGLAKVRRVGAWFPLVEARVIAETQVAIAFNPHRPAPPRRTETRLAIARDHRQFPTLKGADADVTEADRAMARDLGDDDALYLDADGYVIEAANGSVIGWDGTTMVNTSISGVLDGTTNMAMLDHLQRTREMPTLDRDQYELVVNETDVTLNVFRADEVDELWYLNALHGITPVVALDGRERHYDRRRLHAWQAAAATWWEPV